MMDIRLLGDVEVEVDGATFAPDRAAERCVLATLALSPGRPVPVGTFVEHIWGAHPPAKAEETVATYVRAVRRTIARGGGDRLSLANRRLGGYQLDVDPRVVDYRRFVDLRTSARVRHREGDHQRAAETLERALALWRGEALANVTGLWADAHRVRMRRQRLDATYDLLDLHLRAGRAAAMATRATELALDDPTDKTLALAIRGLAASGQRAHIPAFMARTADRMREIAKTRPGPDVVALARQLTSEPDRDGRTADAPARRVSAGGTVTMTATNCVNVFQATGDQYIAERR
jgi:DNA-binding SARP family transcriptional activator